MKFKDLTVGQIVEICKNRTDCKDCPVAFEIVARDQRYTKCLADNLFYLSPPRKLANYILDREIMDVDAGEIVRCADCAFSEPYGCYVSCRRSCGDVYYPSSFCSEGVKRDDH